MMPTRNRFARMAAISGLIFATLLASPAPAQTTNLAEVEGLQLVAPEAAPQAGTFWSWQKQGSEPPYPFNPFPLLPLYAFGTNSHFVVDDSSVDFVTLREDAAAHLALQQAEQQFGLETPMIPELGVYGDFGSGMSLMESDFPPPPGEGGEEFEEGPLPQPAYQYPSNSFWVEIISVTNGHAHLVLHGTEPDVIYEILSRLALTNVPWASEGTIIGAPEQNWTATMVPVGTRTNTLFFWARSWGDTSGQGLPDWWQLQFFGVIGVDPYADPDGDGWMNIEEWENDSNPTVFNAPRAPQPFTARVAVNSNDVTLTWEKAPGSVLNYLIERQFNPWSSFNTLATISASSSNYVDTAAYSYGPLVLASSAYTYRIRAIYAGGATSLPNIATPSLGEDRFGVNATLTRQSDGRWVVAVGSLPFGLNSLKLTWVEWDFSGDIGIAVNATETVALSNIIDGVYLLPDSTAKAHLLHRLYVQGISSNGIASSITDAGLLSEDAPYFVDGREHLMENLKFRLRAASRTNSFFSDLYGLFPFGADFEEMGFLHMGILPDTAITSSFVALDNLWPFDVNQLLRNYLFDPVHADVFDWQTNFVTIPVPPVLAQSDPYWITQPLPRLQELGATLSGDGHSLTLGSGFGNKFGLSVGSALTQAACVGNQTIAPGGNVSFASCEMYAYHCQFANPTFSLESYYFAPVIAAVTVSPSTRVSLDNQPYRLPLHSNFAVTNQTPLLVANVGEKMVLGGWAKLEILNGSEGKFGYLGQYFESAFKVTTNGVVTTNQTGILSPYGEFFPMEPGPTALVTMPIATNWNSRGTSIVHVISLNVDGNHDGVMDFSYSGPDQATAIRPYRFWLNDDDDAGETKGDDIPKSKNANADDNVVNGVRDLVDFFPVCLKVQSLAQALPASFFPTVEYKLKHADGALNFVYTDLSPTEPLTYLTDTNTAIVLGSAPAINITAAGVSLDRHFVNTNIAAGKGMILIEVRGPTSSPLILEVWRDGQLVAQANLPLTCRGVEQMFRQKNLIRAVFTNSVAGWQDRLNEADVPYEPENNGKNFVFAHGYNVNPQQARGAFAETFKRMYWSGSRAKFYGVNYYGYESQLGKVSPNLQTNIVNAFLTAPKLKLFLDTLTNSSTTVAAHSLGNMVVLSALSDWNAPLTKYFMIDAAVAIEAIDGGAAWSTNMVHSDWLNYSNRLWASHWFRLFPTNDYRSTLTWSNRFANLPIASIYNFYSSGEEVLRTHTGPTPDFTGFLGDQLINAVWYGTPFSANVWALQEKLKGRSPFDGILSSTHGGWRFNAAYNDEFGNHLPPAQAALLPDSQLRTNSFFQFSSPGFPSDVALLGVNGSAYAQSNRNRILADAIPAITLPVAANPVPKLSPQNQPTQNFNMQTEFQNGWPASRSVGNEAFKWYHSDFKDVAYLRVYKLFDDFVMLGGLK